MSKNVRPQLLAATLPREAACDHPLSHFLKEATAWKGDSQSGGETPGSNKARSRQLLRRLYSSPCSGSVFLTKGTEIWKDILRIPEYCVYADTMEYMYILKDILIKANLQGDLGERVVIWSISWCVQSVYGR